MFTNIFSILDIIFSFIAVIAFFYGIYQNKLKRKLREEVRANNWYNYERAINANGFVGRSIERYQSQSSDKIDPQMFKDLNYANIYGQEVFMSIIRQIQATEPSFQEKDIIRWHEQGKISNDKVNLFRKFIVDNEKT